ncbi:hypothetical protein [Streptomyces sp. MBT28]|uniref:hypothetical protein n=1 Tax=Streptomyces sp. MBT28 TaxID=1488357 RepID=UPI000696E64A|nr:hypothetical protein [Streptomyces sp. MBT28]
MGDPARGAGRTGTSHPMTVKEAVLALLRPKPELSQLVRESADVFAAAQAAFDAPAGLGAIASYATEVALPATGTWANPGKGGAQADIVITTPEDGVPLLFAEIDNCFKSAQVHAAKIYKYVRFCQQKVKDVDGKERPMWRTRWWVPDGRHGDQPHPPLLLVFNRIGPRNPNTVIAQLAELTERHWKGTWYEGGFHMYDGKPIVVTSMKHLKEHGPARAVFRRLGRPHNQTLLEAIGNPRREAHDTRQQAEYAARQQEHVEQQRRIAAQQKAQRDQPSGVRRLRHPVHRRTVESRRTNRVARPTGYPPAPVRRLQAGRPDCRTPSRASPARASRRASAKGAWNLDVPIPQMSDWAPNAWHSTKAPGAKWCHA